MAKSYLSGTTINQYISYKQAVLEDQNSQHQQTEDDDDMDGEILEPLGV